MSLFPQRNFDFQISNTFFQWRSNRNFQNSLRPNVTSRYLKIINKGAYKIDFDKFDDPNFNPFETKSNVENKEPTLSQQESEPPSQPKPDVPQQVKRPLLKDIGPSNQSQASPMLKKHKVCLNYSPFMTHDNIISLAFLSSKTGYLFILEEWSPQLKILETIIYFQNLTIFR